MEDAAAVGGGLMAALIIFAFIVGVLWFLMPFAVFGVKRRLDRSNELSLMILKELQRVVPLPEDGEKSDKPKDGS